MRWIDRLGAAQRVVVVIALGLALGSPQASYLTSLGTRTGWYAYAPLSGQVFQPPGIGEPGWLRVIIWLAATRLLDTHVADSATTIPWPGQSRMIVPVNRSVGGTRARRSGSDVDKAESGKLRSGSSWLFLAYRRWHT